jgi:hypothetical protein
MVSHNKYVFHGTDQASTPLFKAQIANLSIIISSAGVIAVDSSTLRERGGKLLDVISKITSQAVVFIMNTYIDSDDWLSLLPQFTDGAVNGTSPYSSSVAVSDCDLISIGDTTIKVISRSDKTHTATDPIKFATITCAKCLSQLPHK